MCFFVGASLALSGCAHVSQRSDAQGKDTPSSGDEGVMPIVTLHDVDSFRVTDPEPAKVVDQELESIPTEMNPLVDKWISYFQGKGRPYMERYLSRSTQYSKLIKKILRQNGLPEDLIYIAMIESGFSLKATSHAAAVGYWQFIRGTGRRYGLEINTMVDERRDPVMATQAAAEYFKGLYSVFGSWYLAMAAYNVGENRVQKEVMNTYTRDFWELARKRRFPKETINYIPKFIAAKMIGNNPDKYGFTNVDYLPPVEFEHVQISKPTNLRQMAERMNMDYDDLKQLNPRFKGEIATLKNDKLELRIPIGQAQIALAAADQSSVAKVEYIADAGETQMYKIRRGDSLYTIAHKYHTTVAWLRDTNDMSKGRKLRIGHRLMVPDHNGRKSTVVRYKAKVDKVEKNNQQDSDSAVKNQEVVTTKGVYYVVQAGDNLSGIADDYNSSVQELRRMNHLSRRALLRVGMKLRVPKDDGLPADLSGDKSTDKVADKATPTTVVATSDNRGPSSAVAAIGSTVNGHIVKPGENLSVIAKKYGVSIQALRRVNKLSRRSVLKVGSRLKIPVSGQLPQSSTTSRQRVVRTIVKAKVHVVRKGENLTMIANKYRIPVNTLLEKNNLENASKLFTGTRLLIPIAAAGE
jgi:membrane-bound lytic murein transglycosylase D